MKKLTEVFDANVLNYYKENQSEITQDLLQTLRDYGNDGKKLATEILDMPKDEEEYYLDAYGNRISHDGDRTMKKPFVKLNLSQIHEEEIAKCANDIFYFMNNYVKIVTPKGINYPDMRGYQVDFIDLLKEDHESIVGLLPRQCINKNTTLKINDKYTNIEELFNEAKEIFQETN